jgi:hypothetical protein
MRSVVRLSQLVDVAIEPRDEHHGHPTPPVTAR